MAGDLFRRESARLVAMLAGQFGTHRLQLAEDAVQEALVRALQTWPYRGVPDNPAAWLTQTARNLALDQLRREQRWQEKEDGIAHEHDRWIAAPGPREENADTFTDDTLRMMFVCFHPQLSADAQTALALRTLCGLSAAEIAAAFLTTEAAIAKRLVRARQRIRELALPFIVPAPHELSSRLDGVLATIYLLFNEGYKASSGDRLVREELCHEAIRLALQLAAHPATRQPRTHALLALMLFNGARLAARADDAGNLLRLHEQDRSAWNRAMIERGLHYLALASTGDAVSEYHLQAGVAACHVAASDDASTDWPRILILYDELARINLSPVVALNRAVAVARVHGVRAGLDALDAIHPGASLDGYSLYHAVRGAFTADLGRKSEALAHFRKAEALATLPSERAFLAKRISECDQTS
ncbi:MAG: sigma-70 family RNA polymerase sigma factor [Verrucomicrobia bacterium]|nr:sigma-70 family RNA polymerase sigma factor [Verrucomicrobiota bacterium]MBI3869785.1 sigma-70 family RNA polymerase sigma factor [Verrucomicrobiota bacterium]